MHGKYVKCDSLAWLTRPTEISRFKSNFLPACRSLALSSPSIVVSILPHCLALTLRLVRAINCSLRGRERVLSLFYTQCPIFRGRFPRSTPRGILKRSPIEAESRERERARARAHTPVIEHDWTIDTSIVHVRKRETDFCVTTYASENASMTRPKRG